MPKYRSEAVKEEARAAREEARKVIASPAKPPNKMLELATHLADLNEIGYARKVILKADLSHLSAGDLLGLTILKNLALFTYKDQELPADARLTKADNILADLLTRIPDPPPTPELRELKQDAFGIRGAVHKTRWMLIGSRESLFRSLDFYLAGYDMGLNPGAGAYTGLNAAFILDALVSHLPPDDAVGTARRVEAQQIRISIVDVLKPLEHREDFTRDQWYYAKLAEAYLGNGQYDLARQCAINVARAPLKNWELETIARQFSHIARLQSMKEGRGESELEMSEAWSVVRVLLGGDATAALSFFRGKTGLALSGGGFRASLYHIGVLASLAERDMLRHVEVISCVSGGSILGMYYYLKLRKLLEDKPDAEITREDYIELVRETEVEFLDGVQRNLRMRALFSPTSNLNVLISRASSTTNRLGRLYESELYVKVLGRGPHYMNELKVHPAGEPDFYPRYDNWSRKAKVPIVVLNATTLNTCHNWQFTATFMGEPPQPIADAQIDANDRLRRMYYNEAPAAYRQVRLGDAVAASACVPGLFEPLVLDCLYEGEFVVRLVDGGVFDNQGVATLHEQECQVMLVSDASGQTGIQKNPPGERLSVSTRSNDVLMARIRQCEHQLLCSLKEAKLLRGFMFVHLKKGLSASPIDWVGCSDKSAVSSREKLTTYEVRQDVQRALASVRTDLDSFSNCEADALMVSGYRATSEELPKSITGFPLPEPPRDPRWRFLAISNLVSELDDDEPKLKKLHQALGVSHSLAFKAFQLLPGISVLKTAGMITALAVILASLVAYWSTSGPIVKIFGILAAYFLLSMAAEAFLVRRLRYRNSVLQWITSLLLCLVGGPFLWIHLSIIDKYYINWGPVYRDPAAQRTQNAAAAGFGSSET